MRIRLATAVALAATAAILILASFGGTASAVLGPQLPDLDQVAPFQVSSFAQRHGRTTRLFIAFGSASQNIGQGPLLVVGHRPNRATKLLTADQYIDTGDPSTDTHGPQQIVHGIGVLRYTVSPDHSHFHFLAYMRYELRRASDFRRVGRDHKTGFCLGDRFRVGEFRLGLAQSAGDQSGITYRDFDGNCAKGEPGRLRVVEGISPGKGDDYKPRLEGQSIDVTNLPSGRYALVHHTNPARRIRESSYDNNAASALLSITRRGSRRAPLVRVLQRCPETERCPA